MFVVVAGGFQAFQYFSKQTVTEAKKMDQISEFTALTKDLTNFTEGAGISTFYLNYPIKIKSCENTDKKTEPCIKELQGENFVTPTNLPPILSNLTCLQFYKDAKGVLESKLAYPGKKEWKDKIWENRDIELTTSQNLYATWVIKDQNSPPFLMMKSRDSSLYLRQIKKAQVSLEKKDEHQGLMHSFFISEGDPDEINKLQRYPFLIYNTLYSNQYMIQEAEEIIHCKTRRSECLSFFSKIKFNFLGIGSDFPNKVFAIKFSPINFQGDFFKHIVDRQNLPSNCKGEWGDGKQEPSGYFFPSKIMSVTPDSSDDKNELNQNPVNSLYLGKYAFTRGMDSLNDTAYVALPIDIITYKAEETATKGVYELVSLMWHPTEIKKRVKIHKLTTPITFTRKLGTQEFGVWYNPIKK